MEAITITCGVPLLTACLIVRDEEARLPRCLASLKGVADEIVVVDTGSTDRTVTVAEQAGARVFMVPWADSFAEARNASVREARGQWMLWIDADDELVDGSSLRALLARITADAVALQCRSVEDSGQIIEQAWQPRLLRNGCGIHFAGRVHEQLRGAEVGFNLTSVHIRHHGYAAADGRVAQKAARNLRLLALSVEEEPGEPFHVFNLGTQFYVAERYAEALELFDRCVEMWTDQGQPYIGWGHALFARTVGACVRLGRFQDAVDYAEATPGMYHSSDLFCNAGAALASLRRFDRAAASFRQAIDGHFDATITDPSTATSRPQLGLTMLAHAKRAAVAA